MTGLSLYSYSNNIFWSVAWWQLYKPLLVILAGGKNHKSRRKKPATVCKPPTASRKQFQEDFAIETNSAINRAMDIRGTKIRCWAMGTLVNMFYDIINNAVQEDCTVYLYTHQNRYSDCSCRWKNTRVDSLSCRNFKFIKVLLFIIQICICINVSILRIYTKSCAISKVRSECVCYILDDVRILCL